MIESKIDLLKTLINKTPRIRFANLPTPLQEMPNLSKKLGGPKIFIKRDDLTGLAFGGNKTRKLEFLMAEAKTKGADVIVAGIQGFQSNFLVQTAAAAKKLGMDVVLVKNGPEDGYDPREYDGNHLLQFLLGAEMIVKTREHAPKLEDVALELEENGHRPYVIPHAGSTPLGTFGYIDAMIELISQAVEKKLSIDYIIHATGSAGTQAGLVLGAKALNSDVKVLGISVSEATGPIAKRVSELSENLNSVLGLNLSIRKEDITVIGGYAEEGYGVINEGKIEAIKLTAQTEGVFIDPVYTSTAMSGIIDLVRTGYFGKEDQIVFIHTGGIPSLFPYKVPLKSFLTSRKLQWAKPPW
jgi:D-cysteine desulfhydrase family pyridoxal phosphate-dependent enzyme